MPNENGNVACDTPSLDGKCHVRTCRSTQPSTRALWIVEPAMRRARHGAGRVDGPRHGDAATQRRVLLRLDLVAGLQRALVGHDDAPDLLGAQASVRRAAARRRPAGRARPGPLPLPLPPPVPLPLPPLPKPPLPRPPGPPAPEPKPPPLPGPQPVLSVPEPNITPAPGAAAARAGAVEPRARAAAEHDVVRVEAAERVGHGGDLAQRLLDVRAGVGERLAQAAVVRRRA